MDNKTANAVIGINAVVALLTEASNEAVIDGFRSDRYHRSMNLAKAKLDSLLPK